MTERAEGEEETKKEDTKFGHFTETTPFARGEFRYAYKGEITKEVRGLKVGQTVVIKSWIEGHAMDLGSWQEHLNCEVQLQLLADAWNKLGVSRYTYETVRSVEGQSGGSVDNGIVSDKEWVLVEPFLEGDWTKWNSNTRTHPDLFGSCVQAFCHWTYHHTGGKLLFCDAQGVIQGDRLILTDPCIVSKNPGEYGITDGGELMQNKWFAEHRCNSFCNTKWLKPRREERACAARLLSHRNCTTYVKTMKTDLKTSVAASKPSHITPSALANLQKLMAQS